MEHQINFIENYIIPKMISQKDEVKDLLFVKANMSRSSAIDGFMGNIIFASLEFRNKHQIKIELNVVVKLMKPPSSMRTIIGADYQFLNEVFFYETILPTMLSKLQPKFKKIDENLWCPRVYLTEIGKFPSLSDATETILVMENLTQKGFCLGPRIDLTNDELFLMTKAIAQFHACTYALRINNDANFDDLIKGILPFQFKRNSEDLYFERLYCTGLERLFTYFSNNPDEIDSEAFGSNVDLLKAKYNTNPMKLMNRFLRSDNEFSVILHGDYNRNNVLFKYSETKTAVDLRFIDFQELKYGSPALDLSFFMYMNIHPRMFDDGLNEKLIYFYHEKLIESLCELLDCKQEDARLSTYCWDNFYEHYKQFALYGAMVSVMFTNSLHKLQEMRLFEHYIVCVFEISRDFFRLPTSLITTLSNDHKVDIVPWMACAEDECAKIAVECEMDIFSEELKEISLTCGGKEVNERIVAVLRNASKLGFMEMIKGDE